MTDIPLPTGGIPWVLAAPAFVGLVGTAIGAVKWVVKRADKKIEEAEARVALANADKEKVRADLNAKIEALQNEVEEELRNALDALHTARRGGVRRPPEPPRGIVREKRGMKELLAEVRDVTGAHRLEDIIPEDTQDLGSPRG